MLSSYVGVIRERFPFASREEQGSALLLSAGKSLVAEGFPRVVIGV